MRLINPFPSNIKFSERRKQDGEERIRCLHRSKRFIPHVDVLGQALDWMTSHSSSDSVAAWKENEFMCFAQFPESF